MVSREKFLGTWKALRLTSSLLVLLAIIVATKSEASATWNLIKIFKDPVGCAFFTDATHGYIGTGVRLNQYPQTAAIYQTVDGGITWNLTNCPNGDGGAVTDIYMQSPLVGYASIFGIFQTLWKTTDGGNTWFDFTFGGSNTSQISGGICVYATSKAITFTQWPFRTQRGVRIGLSGGISTDDGATFSEKFTGSYFDQSNGIDFTDDLHGVVTMGPEDPTNPLLLNYRTTDGGLTWSPLASLPEAWGVYGVKGTSTFFCAAEGTLAQPDILRSDDNGLTWHTVFSMQNFDNPWTGHVAGAGNSIYVQGLQDFVDGFYRSDDLGATWFPVGGPSNQRDTRFCVTGCAGEVVYAFDNAGDVYKTTDGGDGTLQPYTGNQPLKLSRDTLYFSASKCSSITQALLIYNKSCLPISLDSVTISGDTQGVFSLQHLTEHFDTIGHADSVVVTYTPMLRGTDSGVLTLHGHQGGTLITQAVILTSTNTINHWFNLESDTLFFAAQTCNSITQDLPFYNQSCLPVSLDSLTIIADSQSVFTVLKIGPHLDTTDHFDTATVTFTPGESGKNSAMLLLHEHQGTIVGTDTLQLRSTSSSGPALLLPNDTVHLVTTTCDSIGTFVLLRNGSCMETSLDSVTSVGLSLGSFHVANNSKLIIPAGEPDSITVFYVPASAGSDSAVLTIHGHQGANPVTLTLFVTGSNSAGSPLVVPIDTLNLFTSYCKPISVSIPIENQSCLPLDIDSATISGDSLGMFTAGLATRVVPVGSGDSILVTFTPNGDGRDTAMLSLVTHQGSFSLRHAIVLASYNQEAPQPEIGAINTVSAGDTTLIPIYLHPTRDLFSITSYAMHLSMNRDVLTPTNAILTNTLSRGATVTFDSGAGGAFYRVKLAKPIATGADLSLPLLYAQCVATLSDSVETPIVLDSFATNGNPALALCTIPTGIFHILLLCGDSTISIALRGELITTLLSVSPNPSSENTINISYWLKQSALVSIKVFDAVGNTIATPSTETLEQVGVHEQRISTVGWASGTHFLMLSTPQDVVLRKLVELR